MFLWLVVHFCAFSRPAQKNAGAGTSYTADLVIPANHPFNPFGFDLIGSGPNANIGTIRRRPLEGLSVLDIGCGGGLLCEPLTRLGAKVTGIDAGEKNIAIARLHAEQSLLEIDYRAVTAESVAAAGERFDIVLDLRREPAFTQHAHPQGYFHLPGGLREAEAAMATVIKLRDLVGEFAGRAEHQRLAAEVARVDRVEQADAEGGGLAAAGLGLGNQVHALEHYRQALRLNRGHLGVTEGLEVRQHGGGKRQRRESGVGHGTGLLNEMACSVTG